MALIAPLSRKESGGTGAESSDVVGLERHQMAFKALHRVFAGERLSDITPFLIEKYKRLRKEEGRSEVTVNRELAFLKNLFTMAMNGARPVRTGETGPVVSRGQRTGHGF